MFAGLIAELLELLEDRKHTEAPEAPQSAPLGRWAWSSSREGVPAEPDNTNEKFLKRELRQHFLSREVDRHHSERHRGISKQAADMILLIRRSHWYEPVFHAPPNRVLFRGLTLKTKSELAKILQLPEEQVSNAGSVEGRFTLPLENGYSTSWSPKKSVAQQFSHGSGRGWGVVLTAEVIPNKFRFQTGPGGLYDVDGISYFHLERETMGIEPILVRRIQWRFLG